MIILDEKALQEVVKNGGKVTPRAVQAVVAATPPETTELLREMKRFSGLVAKVLSEPEPPEIPAIPPIVSVAAPSVTLSPNIQVERPSKWRFTVTQRDPNAQYRIKEILAEPIE